MPAKRDAASQASSRSSRRQSSRKAGSNSKQPKVGDRVTWQSSGGQSVGKVEKKLTSKTQIKGHTAKPTKDDPQYLVRSDKSGKVAAHKPESLEPAAKKK